MWKDALGVLVALVLIWAALLVVLAAARPKGNLLTESVRLLPDLLRLISRLARDARSPAGCGCGCGCCWPTWPCRSTSYPISSRSSATPTTPSRWPWSCVRSCVTPGPNPSTGTGRAARTGSRSCIAWPGCRSHLSSRHASAQRTAAMTTPSSTPRPSRRRHGFTPRHSSPIAHTTRATDPATASAVSPGRAQTVTGGPRRSRSTSTAARSATTRRSPVRFAGCGTPTATRSASAREIRPPDGVSLPGIAVDALVLRWHG